MRLTRRCATLSAPARPRLTIFGANASSCFPSCCGTAGFTPGAAIGRWCPLGELAVGEEGHGCAGLGVERETTVDQTLIRGLVTAFRVFVSGGGVRAKKQKNQM